jgi:hypothetical protein
MLAWKEKRGEKNDMMDGGVFIVDCDRLENEPVLLKDSNGKQRFLSLVLQSLCAFLIEWQRGSVVIPSFLLMVGMSLFVACMTTNNSDEPFFTITSFSLSTLSLVSHLVIRNPIAAPSYGKYPRFSHPVIHKIELAFLANFDYKIVLAKVNLDLTVRWKVVASKPGLLDSAPATAISAWGKKGGQETKVMEARLDLVLADRGYRTVKGHKEKLEIFGEGQA